jgi:hypothetical protein
MEEVEMSVEPDQPAFDDEEPVINDEPVIDEEPVFDEEAAFDFPDPPQTGDPAVDQAIGAVAQAIGGPLEEQLTAYDAAHRTLQDRLADVEG